MPLGSRTRQIDFGSGARFAMAVAWGEARNARGDVRTARLVTSNGYRLTADGVLMAVDDLLGRVHPGGCYTPSQLMGPRCVERLPGSTAIRIG